MPRERAAPPEGDHTRVVLEAAVAALPDLLRVPSCAVLLPSAERNALRTVARRDLSEPQATALIDLLHQREVGALLEAGQPFLPHSSNGLSPALQQQLRHDGWPDLIAVPLPGTGRPVGVLALVPDGDGRWTPARIDAAQKAGVLLGASLRAAVRAGDGERQRRQSVSLLAHLPLLAGVNAPLEALERVVSGVGAALGLSHCLGVRFGTSLFAEYAQSGGTPVGPPHGIERHPLWRALQAETIWTFDDADATAADRSLTVALLNGQHPQALLAVPVGHGSSPDGALLLIQSDRRRRFTAEQQQFARSAAAELAAVLRAQRDDAAVTSATAAPPAPALQAAAAIAAADSLEEIAAALWRALDTEAGGLEALLIAGWDETARRTIPVARVFGGVVGDVAGLSPAPLGDDLISDAWRNGAAGGTAARAMPRPWRAAFRTDHRRGAHATAASAAAGPADQSVLVTISSDQDAAAHLAPLLALLAPTTALGLARVALRRRSEKREHRLNALNDVLLATGGSSGLEDACEAVSSAIRRNIAGIDLVSVWLLDDGDNALVRIVTQGDGVPSDAIQRRLPLSNDSGVGRVVSSGRSSVWQRADPDLPAVLAEFFARGNLQTLAAVPLQSAQRISGTLSLGSLATRHYSADDFVFLEALAGELGRQLDIVTARERAETERQRLLLLVETLPEGLLVIDQEGTVILHSPAAERILDTRVTGRNVHEVMAEAGLRRPEGRPFEGDHDPVRGALRGGRFDDVKATLLRESRDETPLLLTCRPVRERDGQVSGAICVFRDLTSLQELASLKSDFINTVSHELRTPITTIRGGALTLLKRRQFLDEQTQNDLLNDIAEESERLHLLVEDLLSLTRSRSGMNVSTEPVLLSRLVNRVTLELGGRVGGRTVHVTIPTDLPPIDVDPALMQQVLRNLLSNAVTFSPPGAQVEVTAERRGNTVIVGVLDRGSGVPQEDLDRVFEPFYRPDTTVRSGAQGAGLGLAVCRRLVEMQGGRIWAEARAGGGAAFRFTVPVAEG